MTTIQVLLASALLIMTTPIFAANWPPEGAVAELGLPSSTDGGVEIRVWLGGGVFQLEDLYRVVESGEVVSVYRIAWTPKQPDPLLPPKEAEREATRLRKSMAKEVCFGELKETASYLWCHRPIEHKGQWSILLKDLLPAEIWTLPNEPERNCGSRRFDGEFVAIQILQGQRHHEVSYANPEFCCPHVACAIANHVRALVRSEIK
jgi:hypothetical protein